MLHPGCWPSPTLALALLFTGLVQEVRGRGGAATRNMRRLPSIGAVAPFTARFGRRRSDTSVVKTSSSPITKDHNASSFIRAGTGAGWESDVYVFALENTLVPSSKPIDEFASTDKRYEISGNVIFDRTRLSEIAVDVYVSRVSGLLNRMKQPFYVLAGVQNLNIQSHSPPPPPSLLFDITVIWRKQVSDHEASTTLLSMGKKLADFVPGSPRLYAGKTTAEAKVAALVTINGRTAPGIQLSYIDSDAATVRAVLETPELSNWKVYWADWASGATAGGGPPKEFLNLSKDRGQVLEVGTFVELIDFGMILGYHDWGV
eukprot:jgi/Bigna1/75078/fgenesh1_pg.32_\